MVKKNAVPSPRQKTLEEILDPTLKWCPICGSIFRPKRPWGKWCSEKCRDVNRRPAKWQREKARQQADREQADGSAAK